ncbi:response regulator [Myceligenerans pegani]|uniref:Response regulator transcription factor n=1 Tax=Myceligenerans pegani TaxID=2776917 RepID=A0ABR9MZZ0_9MICO|nr:response regulator transcription factor [Myceligenerans sp. TRM 65318]MBE1876398.1 response regulator transcription factor [Myceligenerans sp. TRM 65318]MBE3018669.1 response regulator transcription factor [Myceligenerans sp. TRM 65318]
MTETAPTRVVLVDDQQLVRAGLRMVIDSQPDLTVVGEASDGLQALRLLAATPADVVLMDVRMPNLNGLQATERLLGGDGGGGAATGPVPDGGGGGVGGRVAGGGSDGTVPRVVVLTTFDLDEYVLEAIRVGASGFLLKDAPPEELLAAVRTVHRGDAVIAPSSTRRLLEHLVTALPATDPQGAEARAALGALTEREREVLVLMARGRSNQEIAAELVVAEATVKTHVGRVLAKLGARDRVQAVVTAYETGLVRPGG